MAKRAIVLEQQIDDGDARPIFRVVLWADVPVARRPFYAQADATSAYRNATQAEIDAIRTGAVVERQMTVSADPPQTAAQLRALIQDAWTAFQAEITARNPWSRYGTSWDGTTWTAGGVN